MSDKRPIIQVVQEEFTAELLDLLDEDDAIAVADLMWKYAYLHIKPARLRAVRKVLPEGEQR